MVRRVRVGAHAVCVCVWTVPSPLGTKESTDPSLPRDPRAITSEWRVRLCVHGPVSDIDCETGTYFGFWVVLRGSPWSQGRCNTLKAKHRPRFVRDEARRSEMSSASTHTHTQTIKSGCCMCWTGKGSLQIRWAPSPLTRYALPPDVASWLAGDALLLCCSLSPLGTNEFTIKRTVFMC